MIDDGPRAALARKYRALVALRARRDAGQPAPPRDDLRTLAAEFPGCLRELDTLGRAELERRATACATAAPPEPWMPWIATYHTLMRTALQLRSTSAPSDPSEPADAFSTAVLSPPDGRISIVVFRALAAQFGVPADEIATTLFPRRRSSPYDL
jgi:hypothetical protein